MDFNKLSGKVFLAPMAGVNCTSFRIQCEKYNAAVVFTQMYEVSTIIEKNQDSLQLQKELLSYLNVERDEKCTAIQLIGSMNDDWEKAVKILNQIRGIKFIDINFGCPEEDHIRKKMGSYHLQYTGNVKSIVERCVSVAEKPITAKIRAGWDKDQSIMIAKIIEKAGAKMITVHPRTTTQKYGGKADLDIIKKVKETVSIPVCGNGDITLPGHAKSMIERTKCNFIMIGRAAMKNPEIINYIHQLIETGTSIGKYDKDTKNPKKLALEFIELYEQYENRMHIGEVRDHMKWIFTETVYTREIKENIDELNSVDEIVDFIKTMR